MNCWLGVKESSRWPLVELGGGDIGCGGGGVGAWSWHWCSYSQRSWNAPHTASILQLSFIKEHGEYIYINEGEVRTLVETLMWTGVCV